MFGDEAPSGWTLRASWSYGVGEGMGGINKDDDILHLGVFRGRLVSHVPNELVWGLDLVSYLYILLP